MDFIPIYIPYKATNQKRYVVDCIDSNWISSRGSYIEKFEKAVAEYLGVNHVVTTCNGSVSLMLILSSLGIGPGDEVITQSLTYAATVSSILNVGATPVLIDSTEDYQMDISTINKAITDKTKAVLVAQLYGDSCNINKLKDICSVNNIKLIEDSAECFGSTVMDKAIGSFGEASSFSFFANKNICTGEGGAVVTNHTALANKIKLLKSQSHIGGFKHLGPGYNFRMTNIQAAIGLAQLEDIEIINKKKKDLAKAYRNKLDRSIKRITPTITSSEWMPLFELPKTITYLKFHDVMKSSNIDIRPCFTPIHLMEGFEYKQGSSLETSESIYRQAFNLPSYPDLTEEQIDYIIETVNKIVTKVGD